MKKMSGIVTALTTPFDNSGNVDLSALEKSVDFLVNKGIEYLYPCGTTGEMHLLSISERKAIAEAVVNASGKSNVFVQCGALTQNDTCELIKHAESIGAAGAGVITPSFFSVSYHEMIDYYKGIAKCVNDNFPIYIYNIPQCSSNDITAEMCEELTSECKNIVGIKYSYNDSDRVLQYLKLNNYNFSVLVGMETHYLDYCITGVSGVVSGCSNAFPEIFIELDQLIKEGNQKKALDAQRKVNILFHILTKNRSIARVKAAQHMRGFNYGIMRSPLCSLDKDAYKQLESELEPFL